MAWYDWVNCTPIRAYTDSSMGFPMWYHERTVWGIGRATRDVYTQCGNGSEAYDPNLTEGGPNSSTWCSWDRYWGGTGIVAEIQKALQRYGYSLTADGVFGSTTEAKVKAFQGWKLGPSYVDGLVGKKTWDALML